MTTKKSSAHARRTSLPIETVERRIYFIREQKVMLDSDLAQLYEVSTRILNQAVKRNISLASPKILCSS